MDEQKEKFNWQRSLITALIVLVASGASAGTTYYVLNQNFQKEREANVKAMDNMGDQLEDYRTKDSTAPGNNMDSTKETGADSNSTGTTKATLANTYTNKECKFSLKYPDGFKVTYNGAQNAMVSSAVFYGIDKGFTAYCSGGNIDLVKNFVGEIIGGNNYRVVKNTDGSFSYNIASKDGKLIIIKIDDPNGTFTQVKDVLASLVRN